MKTGEGAAAPAVLLVIGPERWLKVQGIRRLKARCTAPGFEEMDLVRFAEPPAEDRLILEAARTPPFGSPLRLVVVDGMDSFEESRLPWLSDYLAHPNPKACVVLCAENLEKGTNLAALQRKAAAPGLEILWCQPLKGRQLTEWVTRQAQELGAALEPEAADLLVKRLGSEMETLSCALEGVALLAGEGARITREHVEALIVPSPRETAFDILDTAASGRPQEAIGELRQALACGRLTLEHHLMGALGWYYRMVWKARENFSSGSSWVSPTRAAALRRLGRLSRGEIQAALEEVLQADTQLKGRYPAPELLADRLLLKLGSLREGDSAARFSEAAGESGLGS